MAIIAGLACVDGVFLEESLAQKAEYLRGYSADALVMGDDWAGKFDSFAYICEVVYFPRTPSVSTTAWKRALPECAWQGARNADSMTANRPRQKKH